ncbi:MAG: cellulose synthase family protein [Polyangiaceae bacterium]
MSIAFSVVYFAVLAFLTSFGVHRLYLVVTCRANRGKLASRIAEAPFETSTDSASLPIVTVQLPLFNESTVCERLIEATAELDWPRDRLEIQVLDDSTDETTSIASACVERLRARGIDAVYIHRTNRVGYKAGALAHGLTTAKGELVAVFDADFVPQPSFIRSIVSHFRDPKIAMVQTRWGHMNRDVSLLTKVQALQLDGHHLVENRARFGADLLFNFSGTSGMWRVAAIADAGGWQHDTLTEDLDLSYRAQLKGWRFVYRPDVVTPSEVPEEVSAVRAQQYRWAKGTVQTFRKLMGTVLRSDLPLRQRVEAFFHMTPHFAYPLLVVLTVSLLPTLVLFPATDSFHLLLIDLPLLGATTGSLGAFYVEAESAQGRSKLAAVAKLPLLIAFGTGLAPYMSKAVFDGLRSMSGEFVRTPKHGANGARYKARTDMPVAEVLLALVSFASVVASIENGNWFALPFAILFTLGYGYVALLVANEQSERRRSAAWNRAPRETPVSEPPPAQDISEVGAS